jgi:hypothetical protein
MSLRYSTYLSHFFNSLCYLLANNSLTSHFTFFFMGHSYTHRDFPFYCCQSASTSIFALILVSYLPISSLLICWWSPLPPRSRPSVAIFFPVFPPGKPMDHSASENVSMSSYISPGCLLTTAHPATITTEHQHSTSFTCCI